MSYALDLPPEAWRSVTMLPVQLQELVLDEFDRLADAEGGSAPAGRDAVADFVALLGGSKYYIFIVYIREMGTRTIRIRSVGHTVRSP